MPEISDSIVVIIPNWTAVLFLLGVAVLILWRGKLSAPKGWKAVSAEVQFAGLGTVTIQPNMDDVQIAHRAWIELATRKAGVPFDPEHDVIAEVYQSWYELFGRLRELAKECPAGKLREDPDTRKLVWSLTQVLNQGLRPHLTRWNARFRRWYASALNTADPSISPPEVQRAFPQYKELVADLVEVQHGLQRYMGLLRSLATGHE